jgi:hypothetical protein
MGSPHLAPASNWTAMLAGVPPRDFLTGDTMIQQVEIALCEPNEIQRLSRITCDSCGMTQSETAFDGQPIFPQWERDPDGRTFCPLCQRFR